jgi:hypothetical protein
MANAKITLFAPDHFLRALPHYLVKLWAEPVTARGAGNPLARAGTFARAWT